MLPITSDGREIKEYERAVRVPFTSNPQFAEMDYVSKLMRGKSTRGSHSRDSCISPGFFACDSLS